MIAAALKRAVLRAGSIAAFFTLGAVALEQVSLPGPVRALGMAALPCLLFAVLRREDRRLSSAAHRVKRRSMPSAPADPARPMP